MTSPVFFPGPFWDPQVGAKPNLSDRCEFVISGNSAVGVSVPRQSTALGVGGYHMTDKGVAR
jgi:hypothetical protein